MALEYARGTVQWIAVDAIGTTYTVSGLAFQPKALKFSWSGQSSTVNAASQTTHQRRGWGFATGIAARRSVVSISLDNQAAGACAGAAHNDAIAFMIGSTGTASGQLDLDAINADGFRLIVDAQPFVDLTVVWEAWGGTDITVAEVGDIAEPAATGAVDYTVTGLTAGANPGDQVVMIAGCQSTAALNTGADTDSGWCVGFATGLNENAVACGNSDDGADPTITDVYVQSNECLAMIAVAGGNPNARAALTQFNADGFRLNWAARGLTDRRYIFLAIKGGSWRAGEYTIDATTLNATATVSGLPFQPKGLSLISGQIAESVAGTATAIDALSCGSAAGTADRGCLATRDNDAAATSNITTAIRYDAVIAGTTGAGAVAVLIDLDAILADGFRTIVDDADAGASSIWWNGYLTFGDAAGVLAGSAALTFAGTGAVQGAGALAGAAALALAGAATGQGAGALAGAAAATWSGAAALAGQGALAASSALIFDVAGALAGAAPDAIAGSCAMAIAASGLLLGTAPLAGASAVTLETAGVLAGSMAAAGVADLSFTAQASGLAVGALAGSIPMIFTATLEVGPATAAPQRTIVVDLDGRTIRVAGASRTLN